MCMFQFDQFTHQSMELKADMALQSNELMPSTLPMWIRHANVTSYYDINYYNTTNMPGYSEFIFCIKAFL